jgi:hypothetical protein
LVEAQPEEPKTLEENFDSEAKEETGQNVAEPIVEPKLLDAQPEEQQE